MKNAYVIAHHFGDDGNFPAGTILLNIPNQRFVDLESQALVREATAAEVAAAKGEPLASDAPAVVAIKPKPAPKVKRARRAPAKPPAAPVVQAPTEGEKAD